MTTSLQTGLSALNAFATGVQGTAYNIANVNTGGFQPVSVRYQSGKPADQGVRPIVSRPAPDAAPAERTDGLAALSRVDESREMTSLMTNQRSFEANAAVIRASDAMIGTLIDLKV